MGNFSTWFGDLWKHARATRRSARASRRRPRCPVRFEPLEDRSLPASGIVASFQVTEDWGSGFQAQVQLANQQATAASDWKLEFGYGATISSIWDARITGRVGNHYTVTHAGWNSTLPSGGGVSFGFVAAPGGFPTNPTNFILNGVPLGPTTPPAPTAPEISFADVTVTEGNSGKVNALFTVSLSNPATTPVTVRFATADDTARAGSDYDALSGNLSFDPGETAKSITVTIIGDTAFEPDEGFLVNLTAPTGATLTRAQGLGWIANDDAAPPPPPTQTDNIQYQVTSDWGTSFNGQISLTNATSSPITDWRLEFDFGARISGIWDAVIVSHVGDHYIIQNAGWNARLAPGQSASFGFTASPGNSAAGPTNFALSSGPNGGGGPGGGNGGGGGGDNRAPVTADDAAFTTPGQPVAINVRANDTDLDGDALTVTSVTQGLHGSVALNALGNVVYTPLAAYTGTDSFGYGIGDGKGGTAAGTVTVTIATPAVPAAWPAHVFAPYVDMTLYPTFDLVATARSTGVDRFVLAFIVADPQKRPSWGGYAEYAVNGGTFDNQIRAQIATLRAMGGDVVVSFGGASNQELAEVITDGAALKAAYQSVVDAYGPTRIDFDIEGAAVANKASIDRRNQAIAQLQRDAASSGKRLEVWYTLPVLPTGLTPDGLYVVQSAQRHGVNVGGVNIMAMDYGASAAPNPSGRMGDYAIQAATSLLEQLKGLYAATKTDSELWLMVGVTPMIGMNDVTTEIFDQNEARELLAFARQKGIGQLSLWSANRDRQSARGALGYVEPTSSSILQSPNEFSLLFDIFTG